MHVTALGKATDAGRSEHDFEGRIYPWTDMRAGQ